MKITLLISLLALLFSKCGYESIMTVKDKYYYINYINGKIDTSYTDNVRFHQIPDTMIANEIFIFNDEPHVIRKYTSDNHSATDGGSLRFELDSLGIIYSRSTTWASYTRLHSTNDSINLLINYALEAILLNGNLSCYDYLEVFGPEKIKFTIPKAE